MDGAILEPLVTKE